MAELHRSVKAIHLKRSRFESCHSHMERNNEEQETINEEVFFRYSLFVLRSYFNHDFRNLPVNQVKAWKKMPISQDSTPEVQKPSSTLGKFWHWLNGG